MRTLAKTFAVVAVYLAAVAVIYWLVSSEDAGSLLLLGSAAMAGLVATYLARRGAFAGGRPAPEDAPDADPADVAGRSVGSFPFASAWPIVLVAGFVVLGFGVLYTAILLPLGGALAGLAVYGLMRESRA